MHDRSPMHELQPGLETQTAYAVERMTMHAAEVMLSGTCAECYAACGATLTMRWASRAAEIRSRSGMVGMTPPASRRDSAGYVMPARVATST